MSNDQKGLNPYVGPRPFERTARDQERFFGRDQETQEIVSLMFSHPLVLIYAQSGAGKTSLFNARIAPTLEEQGFEVLPLTRVLGSIPEGIEPQAIENLYTFYALLRLQQAEADPVGYDPATLLDKSLTAFLGERSRPTSEAERPVPRAIIFDQFEELFAFYPVRWRQQQEGFFRQVAEALEDDSLLRVVLVIREDYLAQLDPFARLLAEGLRIRFRLERLREDAARQAIEEPLVRLETGRSFAPGVAEGLVKQLLKVKRLGPDREVVEVEGSYVEPVQLQVVCSRLWDRLLPGETVITRDHIVRFGDVDEALSEFYERAVRLVVEEDATGEGKRDTTLAKWPGSPLTLSKRLRAANREARLRTWFETELVTPEGTRGTVFQGPKETGGIPNPVVKKLDDFHLVRSETRAGARWYELTHDRFIQPIQESNRIWRERRRRRQSAVFATVFALMVLVVLVASYLVAENAALAQQAEAVKAASTAAAAEAEATAAVQAAALAATRRMEAQAAEATAVANQQTAEAARAAAGEALENKAEAEATAEVARAEAAMAATLAEAQRESLAQAVVGLEVVLTAQAIPTETPTIPATKTPIVPPVGPRSPTPGIPTATPTHTSAQHRRDGYNCGGTDAAI